MSELKYKFQIPIGDWSDDGHGKCDWFILNCNRSVGEVRELFFQAKKKKKLKGYCPDELCSREKLTLKQSEYLYKMGFKGFLDPDADELFAMDFSTKEFANYVMWFCQQVDLQLKWEFVDGGPMLPFYGFDKKRRHIGGFGYDLFM
jgi:hypothetical protein